MLMMPFQILGLWLRGLFSLALLGGAAYLLHDWYERAHVQEVPRVVVRDDQPGRERPVEARGRERAVAAAPSPAGRWVFRPVLGANRETASLAGGLALLVWSLAGGLIGRWISTLTLPAGTDDPQSTRGGEVHRLRRPDGSVLEVETYGPADGPPIVLTHGWGANSTEWYYTKKHLADRFRLIVWDLPGLGRSSRPENNDYRLENLAGDLDAVLELAGDRPAILAGHSIGGMITLTFCRLFPEALHRRVAGLVLVHTSYTNPVRTTKMAAFYSAIQKPVIEPLLHLTIWLAPLVWLLNVLSYLNGSAHSSTARQMFAGTETRGQVEFVTRYTLQAWPGVYARGMLGMLRYDATAALATIDVPTLVVAADRDTTTTPEASARIRQDVPTAELATLSPAKHMGLIEHNERFDALVREFAESCLLPTEAGAQPVG